MLRLVLPRTPTVAVDVVAWGVFHAATGYAAHRLDADRLGRDTWLLRPRRFEAAGQMYLRRLRIDRWKDSLPEAGDLFPGGINKSRLPSYDDDGLRLLVRETRRAELAHWWAMCCGPLFALWNPPTATSLLTAYGVAVNLPFIAIQRYNRFRAELLIVRRSRPLGAPQSTGSAIEAQGAAPGSR